MYLVVTVPESHIGRVCRILGNYADLYCHEHLPHIAEGTAMMTFENSVLGADDFLEQYDDDTPVLVTEEDLNSEGTGERVFARTREGSTASRDTDGDGNVFTLVTRYPATGMVVPDPVDMDAVTRFLEVRDEAKAQLEVAGLAFKAATPSHDLTLMEAAQEVQATMAADIFSDAPECAPAIERLQNVVHHLCQLAEGMTVIGSYEPGNLYAESYKPGEHGVITPEDAIAATGAHVSIAGIVRGATYTVDAQDQEVQGGSRCRRCGEGTHRTGLVVGVCANCQRTPLESLLDCEILNQDDAIGWIAELAAQGKLWNFEDDPADTLDEWTRTNAKALAAQRDKLFKVLTDPERCPMYYAVKATREGEGS